MAKDHAREFLKKLDADPALRAKLRAARDQAVDDMCKVAAEHGHTFTADELREALHDKWQGKAEFSKAGGDPDDPDLCIIFSERPSL